MKGLKILSAAACAATLAACASTGRDVPRLGTMLSDGTGQNGRACIRLGDIQGYGVLKDDIVSIDGVRNYYLATVLPGCNDLPTSIGILFSGDFGEICGQTMDRIVTGGDQCVINQVFEFEDREEAFATYRAIREQREALKDGREPAEQRTGP